MGPFDKSYGKNKHNGQRADTVSATTTGILRTYSCVQLNRSANLSAAVQRFSSNAGTTAEPSLLP